MPIWKLTPTRTGIGSDTWRTSSWFSPALIRANTPAKARQMAAKAFRKKAGVKAGMEEAMMTSPWVNDSLVVCRRVPVSAYPAEGEEQILEPPQGENRKD